MDELLLKLVICLHTMFIIFVIITPFINSNYFLLLHAVFLPFLMGHWVLNDNTCVLTVVEKNLRKKLNKDFDENECFTCRLIEPIYDFKKNYQKFSIFIYIVTVLLWFVSSGKLFCKYRNGEINNWVDFFAI